MKKAYVEEQSKRLKQRALLLAEHPDFQKRVAEIRKVLKIPHDGIKSNEEMEAWYSNFYKSDDDYFKKKWLPRRKEIAKLRKDEKVREAEKLTKEINEDSPINFLNRSLKGIVKDFKRPFSWYEGIKRYILTNDLNKMGLPTNVSIKVVQDRGTRLRSISIGIDETTRQEDIKKNWDLIKFHQKRLHSHNFAKFQPFNLKVFEKYKKAYLLREDGTTLKEVAEILSGDYCKNSKESFGENDVSKFIERYKKRVDIN